MTDSDALAAALAGDETGFRHLVEPHRAALHAHCYRMLRSAHDAEDALQDTLLRAWRGLPRVEKGRSIRPWLYKIATNVCLDEIARRPRRSLLMDHSPATGPAGDTENAPAPSIAERSSDERLALDGGSASPEARYEQREDMELACVAALQHLPDRQRATLVLREVLAFSAREVAHLLDTTVASVNSALQRARKTIDERVADESRQATLTSVDDDRLHDLVDRLVNAFEAGDVEAILSLLAEASSSLSKTRPSVVPVLRAARRSVSRRDHGPQARPPARLLDRAAASGP